MVDYKSCVCVSFALLVFAALRYSFSISLSLVGFVDGGYKKEVTLRLSLLALLLWVLQHDAQAFLLLTCFKGNEITYSTTNVTQYV